jgi:hypothetical protein
MDGGKEQMRLVRGASEIAAVGGGGGVHTVLAPLTSHPSTSCSEKVRQFQTSP